MSLDKRNPLDAIEDFFGGAVKIDPRLKAGVGFMAHMLTEFSKFDTQVTDRIKTGINDLATPPAPEVAEKTFRPTTGAPTGSPVRDELTKPPVDAGTNQKTKPVFGEKAAPTSTVEINGWEFSAADPATITVLGNKVYLDGKPVDVEYDPTKAVLEVKIIDGNVGKIVSTAAITANVVNGDVVTEADVSVGNVSGNVTASGDVNVGMVQGNVSAAGDVAASSIAGNVRASGDVNMR